MARYNSSSATTTINGTATVTSPYSGAFTGLTGTAPYTVTLPPPTLYPGTTQTFYNSTAGTVTLSTPSGLFGGLGASGSGTLAMPTNTVTTVTSDGTNYIVLSEDGSALVATTGSFTGNVDMSGASSTVTISPQILTISPTGAATINNVVIGGTTRQAGSFLGLNANGQVNFTANTASSSTSTGTLVVTGGIGASGTVYASGVNATSITGTIQTAAQTNITSVGTLGSITTTGAATANNGFASKQWTASCTSGNHIYLMSFGAGAYGSSMSGTLWVRSTSAGAITQARYSINTFGSQNATSGSSMMSYDIYGGAPANFQVYDMGQGTLGAGSALISLMNTSGATCTYDFTFIADSGSGIPTFYASPTVNAGTPTGNIIKFGNQNVNLQTAAITESGGNIGIGTPTPLAKLDIKLSADGDFLIGRHSATTAKLVYAYQSGSDGFLELRTGADAIVTKLSGYVGTPSYFLSNVAIGATVPQAKLSLIDEDGGQAMLQIRNFNTNATGVFSNEYTAEIRGASSGSQMHSTRIHIHEAANDRRALDVSDINGIFTTFVNGKVGIGRTVPDYKLDVNGFARMSSYYAGSTNSTVRLAHIFQGPDLPGTFNQVTNDTGTITQKSIQITTASAGGSTFFFGPYYDLGPGNYQAKFRIKVASNSGSSYMGYIDCVGSNIANGQTVNITPNLFTASNQYQYFNLTFTVTAGGGYVETRWINWQPVTNTSLDHILITPL
jgi:hypothetical protein